MSTLAKFYYQVRLIAKLGESFYFKYCWALDVKDQNCNIDAQREFLLQQWSKDLSINLQTDLLRNCNSCKSWASASPAQLPYCSLTTPINNSLSGIWTNQEATGLPRGLANGYFTVSVQSIHSPRQAAHWCFQKRVQDPVYTSMSVDHTGQKGPALLKQQGSCVWIFTNYGRWLQFAVKSEKIISHGDNIWLHCNFICFWVGGFYRGVSNLTYRLLMGNYCHFFFS